MSTSPTGGRLITLRTIGWCLGIAGAVAAATYLMVSGWLVLTLAGGQVFGIAGLLFFAALGSGVGAIRSKSPAVRAIGKAVCIVTVVVAVMAAALVWWILANLELTW